MSNKERVGVVLDISADVSKIEGSLSSLRNHLSGIQLPKGIGRELETRMSKLSDEIKNFQNLASKAGNSFDGAKQIDASYKKILEYTRKVENSFSAIKDEFKIDASKLFPKEVLDRIEKAEGAMADYYKAIEKGSEALIKQRKELKDIESALDKNKKKQAELLAKQSGKKTSRDAIVQEQTKVKTDKTKELNQEQKSLEILKQRKIALDAEKAAIENLAKKKEALEKSEKAYSSKKAQYGAKDDKSQGEKAKFNADKKAYAEAEAAAKKYGETIRSISDIEIEASGIGSDIKAAESAIKGLNKEIESADSKIQKAENAYNDLTNELKENEAATKSFKQQMSTLKTEIEQTENGAKAQGLKTLAKTLEEIGIKVDPTVASLEDIQKTINNLKPEAIKALSSALDKAGVDVNELDVNLDKIGNKNRVFQESVQETKKLNDQVDQLKGSIQQFFSLTNSVMLFKRGVQQAIETIKELDAAMTETAVVTDFSIGDMWDQLPRYTQAANELGTTTLGAYQTMTLFYQQGLNTNEAFEIGTETMKMARIAGLEYADATNLMTAALRGFNMELNEDSATRINDVYSELAAITAADTQEIASAMTKTASIAASANMEFETTAALLSQIIETTREPAETAGTAMKTIIARFTEMKKATGDLVSVDGEEVSVNKVEAALKSAGVALRDVNGEFRDLDDVFLELSSKWNNLDMMTQRYVATMAAGSRQQSRFIAMMQDYDRTLELVDAAYNSSGASQTQFEKTQDSLESKLNRLKNAWDEFLMGISNSTIIKAGVDLLTGILNVVNKITGAFGEGAGGALKFATSIGALVAASKVSNKALSSIMNYVTSLKEMNKVRTTGAFSTGAMASPEQKQQALAGNRKYFAPPKAPAKKASRWQKAVATVDGRNEAKQDVIDTVNTINTRNKRKTEVSALLSQTKENEASLRKRQASLSASGRLTPELDKKFTKDIEKANLQVQALQKELLELEKPIKINLLTEAARAKVEVLEAQIKADPLNADLQLELEKAKAQLEIFERAEMTDDIEKKVTADTKPADLELEAFERKEESEPIVKKVITAGKDGFKNGKVQNWFKGADSSFNTSMKDMGEKTKAFFQSFKKGGAGASKVAGKLGGKIAAAGGTAAKGLGSVIGVLANIPVAGWIAAAAVVAAGTAIYAAWYNSGVQISKRLAEAQAATLEDTRAQVDALTTQVQELGSAWESLQSGQAILDGLAEGTIEWSQKLQELNGEVQTLLQKYPELYKYLEIDQGTGQWSLNEAGYKAYEEKQSEELKELKNRELYEQAMSNYSTKTSEALQKASKTDEIVNWGLSTQYTEDIYLEALQDAYAEANGVAPAEGKKLNLDQILKDEKTLDYIDNMTSSQDFWGSGAADEKVALEYFQTKNEAERQLKAEEDAYVRNYLATQGTYGAQVQEAVAQTMYDLPSMYKQLEQDRSDAGRDRWWSLGGYDGKTGGAGAKMQGEGDRSGRSVQQIMEDRGYELVDKGKNYYRNKYTGEYVNVDAVGGGAAGGKKKRKKVNGEEVKMETWSNEYVRDIGRQDELRRVQEQNMQILAEAFAADSNLAKIAAGDLSAYVDQVKDSSKKDITGADDKVIFDYDKKVNEFEKNRSKKMDQMNQRYNNVFSSTGKKTVDSKEIKTYKQETYEAAQATVEFEDSVKSLGDVTSQSLTATFLALQDLENPDANLNTVMDVGDSDPNAYIRDTVKALNEAGISASNLKDYVGKIDMSSAINGARQLKNDLEAGGEEAIMAATVLGADQTGSNFFSTGNQFKELISGEQWMEKTQAGLSEIYKLEGKITADNIRELAEENSDLAAVLDTNSLKASGFAKMMEAVEDGTISLADVTSDLIELYDDLYYTADLAGEAIARLESVEIGKSDTEIGKIYSESWAATKDLIDRGAYGDSQIDDYMNQMVGESTWTTALANAGGDKTKAREQIDKQYGLSENEGNLYGSWKAQMKQNNNSIADGAITMGQDGKINYDLSKVNSTEQLISKMMNDMGVTKEYAEAMLADMKTYSKTFGSDLDDLDKRGTLDDFLDSRTTKDGVLNISAAEKATFAKARGQSVDEFEKDLKNMKGADGKPVIKSFEDRQYSESGYYHSSTDEEGNKTVKFTDDTAKQEVISQAKEAMVDMEGAEIPVKITTEDGEVLNPDLLNSMIGVDSVREIMLDPNLSKEEKLAMLQEIEKGMYGSTTNGLAEGLLGETSMTNAQNYSNYMGDEIYNKMGGALQEAMNLLAAYEVFVPMDFKLPIGIPAIEIAGVQITEGFTVAAVSTSGAGLTIGGESASMTPVGGGSGFTPRNNKYTPATVDVDADGGGGGGGSGSSYEKGDDETNTGDSGGGGGSEEEENNTDPHVVNAEKRLEALDRRLERREIDAVEYKLEQDKLYQEKKAALEAQKKAEEEEAEYLDEYYKYDSETDTYLYLEDAYNKASDETKNKIDEEIEKLITINDELNNIEDAIEDFEFKDPADEERFYRAEGEKINAETELAHIDRLREESGRYGSLVGKLPSEVQGPLNMGLLGLDAVYEAQEIQVNQGLKNSLEEQMRSKYNDSSFAGKYYTWDERTQSFIIDSDKIANTVHNETTRTAIFDEFKAMQDMADSWKEVSDELSGGVIQKGITSVGKALKSFSDEVWDADFNNGYLKIETGFEALDNALNALAEKLDGNKMVEKILETKVLPGLHLNEDQLNKIFENEKFTNFLDTTNTGLPLLGLLTEGVTVGMMSSGATGLLGSIAQGIGGLMNFDMMEIGLDIFNGAKGMIDQGKQMVEKIIGYITQATQVIVDAWTNREDYLYNFLKIIEKHLQEYENLQREDNQFQKGRTASVEDIKRNWNEQWKSLQTQLEEQQERLETRQQELNRSRWNPFQLISGWDPTSDTLYENREVKFLWDVIIGLGEAFAPFGTGAFFSQMNQLYEDYDQRVQNSYEDRLAAEQAVLDIEDQRLELVKAGAEEATQFEQKVLDALIQKEQEQIDELTRLNESITDANSKLISTLQNNLEKMRQDRENEKKEEELGEKERRLAYLRQDTSGANMMEIKKLEEELEEGHEDYTDTLIDQKISELQEQNDKAAEQRQQQIELLQAQLEWNEKYGLYWDTIYGMLYTFDENGNVILKPENFDVDGNIRENSELAKMLGTFSDRIGMSTWSAVLDSEELKLLGKYYGAFVGVNGVDGNWKNRWALDDPGADDPNYAYPEQEIPEGVWGVLYSMEIMFKKYFVNSNLGIANGIGRVDEAFKNAFGKLFGNEELANYKFEGYKAEQVQSTFFAGLKKAGDDAAEWFAKAFSKNSNNAKSFALNAGGNQNYGDTNINNTFTIGTVGQNISLDDMVDKVSNAIKGMFTSPINGLQRSR